MRTPIYSNLHGCLFVALFLFNFLQKVKAQIPIAQIEGYLEVYHPNDTTSVYIGKNAGTNVFLGTLKSNTMVGTDAGRSNTSAFQNSFFGNKSGEANITGQSNSFFGYMSGASNTTGSFNSFFGAAAGSKNTTGTENSFFGYGTGSNNTTGSHNSFFGRRSGLNNTTGGFNSFFGREAGVNNLTGANNSFFGAAAGNSNISGANNSFFGRSAGLFNTSGISNSFFGQGAGQFNTTGGFNSFFGRNAGRDNATAIANSFFGHAAGEQNTTGTNNTFLGHAAGRNISTQSHSIIIGANAGPNSPAPNDHRRLYIDVETSDTPLIYGDFNQNHIVVNGALGIGAQPSGVFPLRTKADAQGDLMEWIDKDSISQWHIKLTTDQKYLNFSESNAADNVLVLSEGQRVGINKAEPTVALDIVGDLAVDGDITSTGTINGMSDISQKEEFEIIDALDVLDKIAKMPITEWKYKGSPYRHIGPMAQDFYAAFGLGQGKTTIATVDADGVSLAAIKALAIKYQQLEGENQDLKKKVEELDLLVKDLVVRLK